MMKQQRSGGILNDESRGVYLVVKGRCSKKWGFPKGHSENGETPWQTAKREIKEETGIEMETSDPGGFHRFHVGGEIYYVICIDSERYNDLHPNDINEIEDCQWKTLDDLLSLSEAERNNGLRRYLRYLQKKKQKEKVE